MLSVLRVKNFVLIDELEVEPGPGLNVLTGETGAGKSVLLAALQLVLGARARPDLVRAGAERAEVEALFDVRSAPGLMQRLAAAGLEPHDELVIRRVVEPAGRSRAYVNGQLVPGTQLAALASGLVDISSQHEHQTLADPSNHLAHLDAFAGLDSERAEVAAAVAELRACAAELAALRVAARTASEREAFLRFQLAELSRIDVQPGEDVALAAEIEQLRAADQLSALLGRAEDALCAADGAATARIARVVSDLAAAARLDASLEPLIAPIEAACAELEDAGRELARRVRSVRYDPERLVAAEDRLHTVRQVLRRFGTVQAVLDRRAEAEAELASLDGAEDRLAQLEQRRQVASDRAVVAARRLSEGRRRAAAELGAAITSELRALGMASARLEVTVAPLPVGADGLEVDGTGLGPTGVDRVEFCIAPNKGEPPRPLRRIASGGELSRTLLALKRVLAGSGDVAAYVFDEVDTGVGGAIADVIGARLADVARHHQVLCITHLPQVAAYGGTHLHVRKLEEEGRTRTVVTRLTADERVEELARMLGGLTVTDAVRAAAVDLLGGARQLAA
jgi:DNA repair protein RecN (Recombination protein N)